MFKFMKLGRYFRTLKHLPPRMLTARLAYRARCLYYASPVYSFQQDVMQPPKAINLNPPYLWKGSKTNAEHLIAAGAFTAQNHTEILGENLADPLLATSVNWLPEGATMLWHFTLHYHDFLSDLRAHNSAASRATAQTLVADWLLQHDHFHPLIWHPYPTSLRLVNWLTHAEWLTKGMDGAVKDAFMASLLRQADHLRRNCETWLGGNHYIKNLKALIYAGLVLPNQHAIFWQNLEKFMAELSSQILPDGTHDERSPSYHVQVLKDVLDVHALIIKAGHTPPHQLTDIIERMSHALALMQNPDGTLPLFNDGETHTRHEIQTVLKRCGGAASLPAGAHALPDAGYVRLKNKTKPTLSVFFDSGAVGPNINPGHAHADTLSFELFLGDEKVFTNQGTYLYQCAQRNHYRGSSAHNTVDINGISNAEVWAGFRVGRRPQTTLTIEGHQDKSTKGQVLKAIGTHNGFKHLGIKEHTRTLTLESNGHLFGQDCLIGRKKNHKAAAHFHLHPDVTLTMTHEREAILSTPSGKKLKFTLERGRFIQQTYDYAPRFGQRLPAQKLVVALPPIRQSNQEAKPLNWEIQPQ